MSGRHVSAACATLFLFAGLSFAQSGKPGKKDPAADIRKVRDAFNRAIEAHNAAGIREALAPSYQVVTGRGDKLEGRDEEVRRWIGRFRADRRLTYTRTSKDIVVNESWGIAHETGEWVGRFTSEAKLVRVAGIYSARWQRADGGPWRIDSEIFVTLSCEGPDSGCIKPDPIP